MTSCPCGSGLYFSECCRPIIDGLPAPTPEALMRSRYSAFATGNIGHVERTQTSEINSDFNRAEAEQTAAEVTWLGLEINSATQSGNTGMVDFFIRFRRDEQVLTQHEISSFRREQGRWLYASGIVNPQSAPAKADKHGRNDPCPCGSKKKYKKCCGS